MQSIAHMRARHRMAVGAFLARLSPATRHARYLGPMQFEGHSRERELARLQSSAAGLHTVLLALEGDEVRGIGTLLFLSLEQHAWRRGVRAFTGEVANGNQRVLAMLRDAARPLRIQPGYASSHFELTLCDCADSLAA
jgi:hypothetical protein